MKLPWPLNYLSVYLATRRSAQNTISILKKNGIVINTIFDVGANNSQWTRWLIKEWKYVNVHSFEPLRTAKPLGKHYQFALGDSYKIDTVLFKVGGPSGTGSNIATEGDYFVDYKRFDGLDIIIPINSIVKIDCEDETFGALKGFGERINEFKALRIKMLPFSEHNMFELFNYLRIHSKFKKVYCVESTHIGPIDVMDFLFI